MDKDKELSPDEIALRVAVMKAAVDQMKESVKSWADLMAAYYNSLKENMPIDLAYRLTIDYQSINLQLMFQQHMFERHNED